MVTVFFNPDSASHVYDSNGKQVGIWYSGRDWTTVKNVGENGIAIYTPLSVKGCRRSTGRWFDQVRCVDNDEIQVCPYR
jgi:hypothetical protein